MSSSSVECGTHLTTSRINRLLRPLRNKCTSLAALPKPATASRVTYSKQLSNWDPDSLPPLTVLRPPAGTKKLTLDRRSADEFELSRRIHAVCDAFRNVVHVAFGVLCCDRIPSLAAMCTLVIGQNMPITNTHGTSNDSDEEESADDILDVVDRIYEAVPPHYRRFSIVSHALSMILCICTHHHTLVNLLLDHCLAFGLVHESTRLLDIILSQAFLPSNPLCPPPVTHPAHMSYLLDLHAKWTTSNRPSGSSSPLFTTSAFSRGILGSLSKCVYPNGHILWTSKVFNRFLRVVETSDIDSYIFVIHTLSRDFWEISGSSPDVVIREGASVGTLTLKAQLSEWMSSLFDLLFLRGDTFFSPLALSQIQAVVEILNDSHAAWLHTLRASPLRSPIDLPDIIIVFTTHIFVTFAPSIVDPSRLLAILDDSNPVPTTFAKLMSYFCRLQTTQTFDIFVDVFLSDLRSYSSALRSHKLFGLDASLWACALHHFEISIAGSQGGHSATVTKYKQQLMEAVDAAERRCFGGDLDSSPFAPLSTHVDRAKRTRRGRLSGHWEWEEMVGSWIRKTPVHKKRKVDGDDLRSPLRDRCSHSKDTTVVKATQATGSTSISTPSSSRHKRSSTFSPSSSFSQFSEPESHTEDGSEYQEETDKENYPTQPAPAASKTSRPLRRHSSNFFSLLADAQMNRIVLHSKPQPEPKPPFSVIPEKYVRPPSPQDIRRASHRQEQKGRSKHQSPLRISRQVDSVFLLPSDDSLDLFAYATSSPAKC